MKITFLGTGTSQGIPVIGCGCEVCKSTDPRDKRLRSSIFIEWDGLNLVVDTGPDFRQQMLKNDVQYLDTVLFTHAHRDHTAGLDDIRSFNFKQKMDMPIYGPEPTLSQIKRDFSYIFDGPFYPGLPRVILNPIDQNPIEIKGKSITPIEVLHYKLPVFGYRFGDFTYITDAKTFSEEALKRMEGSRVLVLNALRKEDHISHLTLSEALKIIEKVQPEKAYLTHASHQLGLHKEIEAELPESVFQAYDNLQLELK